MFLTIKSASIAYFSKLRVYLMTVDLSGDSKPSIQVDLWPGADYVETKSSVAVTAYHMWK